MTLLTESRNLANRGVRGEVDLCKTTKNIHDSYVFYGGIMKKEEKQKIIVHAWKDE